MPYASRSGPDMASAAQYGGCRSMGGGESIPAMDHLHVQGTRAGTLWHTLQTK